MIKYTKELQKLINRFDKKLEEAQDARSEVMAYIEDHYDIDTREHYEEFEDELIWCYGIDAGAVQDAIEKLKEE